MGIRLSQPADSAPPVAQSAALTAAQKLFDHPALGSVLATCTFFDSTDSSHTRSMECWAFDIDPSGDVGSTLWGNPSLSDAGAGSTIAQPPPVKMELVFIDATTGAFIKGIAV
jgi:hypothetical protein